MKTSAKAGSLWVIAASASLAILSPSCGDGDPTDVGVGGSSGTGNRGGTSTGGRGGSMGGSDAGGSAGQGGTTTGGSAGSAGQGGAGGSAGTAGSGNMGGEGGDMGGEGGQGGEPSVVLYDFETGVQGWNTTSAGASVSQSTDQHVDGANSLKITHAEINNANIQVQVDGALAWPGTVITFNAFLPAGLDTAGGTYFQAFMQGNNFQIGFDTMGNSARTAVPGGLTTWTYTVPNTFPGGLNRLGFQLGDNAGGTTIPAGDVYIDSITATGGVANCAIATPAGLHDFETSPLDGAVYQVDANNPAPRPTLSQVTDRAFMGSGSMKVSFAALPAPTGTEPTKRIVYIDKPNVYCGQTMTVHVFLPTGSDGMTFQVFAQYNNFGAFSGTGALIVSRNAWNSATFTIPTTVGPGGIQRVGLEFMYSGTAAFTGDAWVDAISW